MIDRNIGKPERIVRFALAVILLFWVITGETLGITQGVALLVAFALLWNSIFARCYLWKWLRLSSCNASRRDCKSERSGAAGGSSA